MKQYKLYELAQEALDAVIWAELQPDLQVDMDRWFYRASTLCRVCAAGAWWVRNKIVNKDDPDNCIVWPNYLGTDIENISYAINLIRTGDLFGAAATLDLDADKYGHIKGYYITSYELSSEKWKFDMKNMIKELKESDL